MANLTLRVMSIVLLCGFWASTAAAQNAALVQRGQKVYAEQKCSICHSVNDQGNRRGPLDAVGVSRTADEIREWIVNAPEVAARTKAERKPMMRAFTSLEKADVDALVAYLLTLKKT